MARKSQATAPLMPTRLAAPDIDPFWRYGAAVDCETTGLNQDKDELIEIAVILFAFDRNTYEIKGIVDEYVGQKEPVGSIPRAATDKHGLTKRMLKGKDFDYARLREVAGMADFYVAYNAEFDEGFCGSYLPPKPWYCCMKNVVWTTRTDRWQKLEKLLKRYNITQEQSHRAGDDACRLLTLLSVRNRHGNTFFHEMMTRIERSGRVKNRPQQEQKAPAETEKKQEETAGSQSGCGCLILLALVVLIYSWLRS